MKIAAFFFSILVSLMGTIRWSNASEIQKCNPKIVELQHPLDRVVEENGDEVKWEIPSLSNSASTRQNCLKPKENFKGLISSKWIENVKVPESWTDIEEDDETSETQSNSCIPVSGICLRKWDPILEKFKEIRCHGNGRVISFTTHGGGVEDNDSGQTRFTVNYDGKDIKSISNLDACDFIGLEALRNIKGNNDLTVTEQFELSGVQKKQEVKCKGYKIENEKLGNGKWKQSISYLYQDGTKPNSSFPANKIEVTKTYRFNFEAAYFVLDPIKCCKKKNCRKKFDSVEKSGDPKQDGNPL